MNNFSVRIKKDGEWVDYDATAVFPFRFGELLDERLDEAYLDSYGSDTPCYEATTEMAVSASDGVNTRTEHYILARDDSYRYPLRSEKYRHSKYLIERTKLLDGVLCGSLTFTNPLKNHYDTHEVKFDTELLGHSWHVFNSNVVDAIRAPLKHGAETFFPSALAVFEETLMAERSDLSSNYSILDSVDLYIEYTEQNYKSGCTVKNGDDTLFFELDEEPRFIAAESVSVEYVLAFQTSATGSVMNGAYIMKAEIPVKNVHPRKKWTVTECINRINELAEPLRMYQSPRFTLAGTKYNVSSGELTDWDASAKYEPGSDADIYDKIYAPEFTMSQCTWREQLKVVGSFIHAEPWLDENDRIHFKPYGASGSCPLEGKPFVYDSYSHDINGYCTDVRSVAQNLVSSMKWARGVVYDPGENLYRSLRGRSMYARVEEGNGVARTEHPIYNLLEVWCAIINEDGNGYFLNPCDITRYVFEATEYSANLSSYSGSYPYSKEWAIYYTIGSSEIDGMFYRAPHAISSATYGNFAISNILGEANTDELKTKDIEEYIKTHVENLIFQVVYKPITTALVSHGKQEYVSGRAQFTQPYNQSEPLINSDFYGENVKGVAARLGNVERERTYILHSLKDIPEVGQTLDGYAVSAVSCEILPYHIKCSVGLTKDFQRISQYVGVSGAKRIYEVSEREAYRRDILIHNYLVIGKVEGYASFKNNLLQTLEPIKRVFEGDDNGKYRVSYGKITTYQKDYPNEIRSFLTPVIPRALGNAITFSFSPKDNYSAGDTLSYVKNDDTAVKGWWQDDYKYVDAYGQAYWLGFNLYGAPSNPTDNAVVEFSRHAPEDYLVNYHSSPLISTGDAPYLLRKDNREIPSVTVELEIKTTVPGLNIGSALARLSRYVNTEDIEAPHLYLATTRDAIYKFAQSIDTTDTQRFIDVGTVVANDLEIGGFYLGFSIRKTIFIGGVSDNLSDFLKRNDIYGWVIAVPSTTATQTFEDHDGTEIDTVVFEGGDVLISRILTAKLMQDVKENGLYDNDPYAFDVDNRSLCLRDLAIYVT